MDIECVFKITCAKLEGNELTIITPGEFSRLVELVVRECNKYPAIVPVNSPETQVLTAMVIQGFCESLPDEKMCEELFQLASEHCKKQDNGDFEPEALLDLVAAFGCGWNRDLTSDQNWTGLWSGSFVYLVKRAERVVRSIHYSLQDTLHVRFPESDSVNPGQTAQEIVVKLVYPMAPLPVSSHLSITAGHDEDPVSAGLTVATDARWEMDVPVGGRAVYSCTYGAAHDKDNEFGFQSGDIIRLHSSNTLSQIRKGNNTSKKLSAGQSLKFMGDPILESWACTCASSDCERLHRLTSWAPDNAYETLQNFLYTALRGKMTRIRANAFAESLLGAHWASNGWGAGSRLSRGPVAHHVCPNCVDENENGDRVPRAYMGKQCDQCRLAATNKTAIVSRDRLIVVNSDPSMWDLEEFWRCGNPACHPHDLTVSLAVSDCNYMATGPELLKKALNVDCSGCGTPVFSRQELDDLLEGAAPRDEKGSPIPAKTLRETVRRFDRIRKNKNCPTCGDSPAKIVYCVICESTEGLKRSPTFLFVPSGA